MVAVDDTHPEVRRLQFERLRRLSIEQRLAMVGELSAMTTHLSRQVIRMAMPGAPEHAVILRWIELVYGAGFAARVAPLAHRLGREAPRP